MGGGGVAADLSRWPLVGREDELALALEAIAQRRGVVLTGAAGVGKTRLARELVTRGADGGGRTEWISATAAASRIPLGAAAHLIPSEAIGRGRDNTLRGIVAAFERESERGPLLLGVDDAHLLDDGSAALVHLLATTGTASVVVTVRSGEPAPDAVVSLWKDGPATLIALQTLARHEVEELVSSVLDGPIEGALLHLLWESSSGNALYLRELVQHGLESGSLRSDRGLWRWHGTLRPGERLHGLVALRMGALEEEERATLELVAVGEPLPLECLRALDAAAVVDRLERRGLLASQRRGTIEIGLGHPLFGEVLRAQMTPTRLDDVRIRLADGLEPLSAGSTADQFRIVLWRADAGDRSRPDQLRSAARRAWALWDAHVAERLARAALESGPDLEAGYLLGEALSDQGRAQEALDAWEAVEELDGPDRIRATLAVGHSSQLNYHFGRPAEAEAVLRRARARVSDPSSRGMIDGSLAMFNAMGAHTRTIDSQSIDAPNAALAATLEQATGGNFDAAERTANEAIATSHIWGDEFPTVALLIQLTRAWARLMAGRVSDVESEAELQYTTAVAEHIDYPRVSWCLMRGVVGVLRGLPRTAARALTEGIAVLGSDDRGWLRPMHAYMSMACALEGDIAAAEEHERRAANANRSTDGIFAIDLRRARAWARAARGEITAALEEARAAADQAEATGQAALESFALHDVARFGRAAEVVERLTELGGRVDGPLVDAFAAHARALADADGRALDQVASDFASLELDLFAAEASAAAARAYREEGRRASAYAALDRSRVFARRCESARTPALALADEPADLTGREREVAELAAAGLASRDIADRLGIATRTVDNLLGRVYVKLGLAGRRELVELLGQRRSR